MLARVIDWMMEAGIRRFIVVVGDHAGLVDAKLGQSFERDVEIRLVRQDCPTGTGDALRKAAPFLEGPFLLSAVDNITSNDHLRRLIQRFEEEDQLAVLSLLPASPEQIRSSSSVNIESGRITRIEEKPETPRGRFAAIMVYAFSPRIVDYMNAITTSRRGEREIATGIQAGLSDGRRVGYVEVGWRLHLTRPIDLLHMNMHYLKHRMQEASWSPSSAMQIIPPVHIEQGVKLGNGVRIGPNVYLESGASVGHGATVRDAVILSGGVVKAGESCFGELLSGALRVSDPELGRQI